MLQAAECVAHAPGNAASHCRTVASFYMGEAVLHEAALAMVGLLLFLYFIGTFFASALVTFQTFFQFSQFVGFIGHLCSRLVHFVLLRLRLGEI